MEDFQTLGAVLDRAPEVRPSVAPISTPGSDTPPARVRGISPGRLSDSLDNFDLRLNPGMAEALELCRRVAAGEARCAFLAGDYGVGKTHLAIGALNARRQRHDSGYFWKVPDFLDWLRQAAFDGAVGIQQASRIYGEANALIAFDDLGAENPTDWAHEQLYRVFDMRYDLGLPTILTSNVALDRLDGRILSRYRAGLIICSGRDLRASQG
jgi:DNA replication protein DnaC